MVQSSHFITYIKINHQGFLNKAVSEQNEEKERKKGKTGK